MEVSLASQSAEGLAMGADCSPTGVAHVLKKLLHLFRFRRAQLFDFELRPYRSNGSI
jgi:hypothetical protein